MIQTHGIHHVSSIVGHAQENIDFNAGILALRLVKKTLNYDDKDGYHLYYANDKANSGITTTFPMNDSYKGEMGGGQVASVQYAIRPGQIPFWEKRLKDFGIQAETRQLQDRTILSLSDPSGLRLEMTETEKGPENGWSFAGVKGEQAIIGIEAATLVSLQPDETLKLLTEVMGYRITRETKDMYELQVHDELGSLLYLSKKTAPRGRMGAGTVHHIAFSIKNDEAEAWQKHLADKGYHPTGIKNRNYFKSIYFREKGGILFEFATEGPGFFIDEDEEHAGEKFIIPAHFKAYEEEILSEMMPLEVREIKALGSYTYRNRYEYELVQKRNRLKEEMDRYTAKQAGHGLSEEETAELTRLRQEFVKAR